MVEGTNDLETSYLELKIAKLLHVLHKHHTLLMSFSTSSTMLLSYDSHPLQSFHPYELLIQDIECTHYLVSLDHQVLQPLHLVFFFRSYNPFIFNLHSIYSVLVLPN